MPPTSMSTTTSASTCVKSAVPCVASATSPRTAQATLLFAPPPVEVWTGAEVPAADVDRLLGGLPGSVLSSPLEPFASAAGTEAYFGPPVDLVADFCFRRDQLQLLEFRVREGSPSAIRACLHCAWSTSHRPSLPSSSQPVPLRLEVGLDGRRQTSTSQCFQAQSRASRAIHARVGCRDKALSQGEKRVFGC